MFRGQQNAFDEVVVKATDENLTSENWEYILDVCDKVASQDTGAKDAVAAMIKRLAHRNANVQLYTLELANAVSQNCGAKMHKELASRSFTDALLRLAADRNTHQQVKTKILELMGEWTKMFAKDADLGIMEGAYMKLRSQNPNLHPPSKPQKTQMSSVEREREEQELQMALSLSLQDKSEPKASADKQQGASDASQTQEAKPLPQGTTAVTVSRVRALYDFTPSEAGELAFRSGDIIAVLESVYKDWWKGSLRGNIGIFPLNYVEKLQDPTQEELEREAVMEQEVFGQIGNVEKLLALLSTSSKEGRDIVLKEEITELYRSTLAIRPKLVELIGKYSQKKDDFTQLNEKFIKARRDYENLLEQSMAQPPPGRAEWGRGQVPIQQYPQGYDASRAQNQAPYINAVTFPTPGTAEYEQANYQREQQAIQQHQQIRHGQQYQQQLQQQQQPPQQRPSYAGQGMSSAPGQGDDYARQASGGFNNANRPASAYPPAAVSTPGPPQAQHQPQQFLPQQPQQPYGAAPTVQELATGRSESPLVQHHTGGSGVQPQPQQIIDARRQDSYDSPTSVYSQNSFATGQGQHGQGALPPPTTYAQPQMPQQQQQFGHLPPQMFATQQPPSSQPSQPPPLAMPGVGDQGYGGGPAPLASGGGGDERYYGR